MVLCEFGQTYHHLETPQSIPQAFLIYIYSSQSTGHSQLFSQEVTMKLRAKDNAPLKGVTLTSSDTRVSLRVGCSNSNAHWLHCRQIRIYEKPLWLYAGVFIRPYKMQKRTRSVIMDSDQSLKSKQLEPNKGHFHSNGYRHVSITVPETSERQKKKKIQELNGSWMSFLFYMPQKITEVMQTKRRLHHFSMQENKQKNCIG